MLLELEGIKIGRMFRCRYRSEIPRTG